MSVLALDLAAKFSAWVQMDTDYRVLRQADSWQKTEEAFLFGVTSDWHCFDNDDVPDVLVCEDLPHGLNYSTLIKAVCRLQGRLVQYMHESYHGSASDVLFVSPAAWRAHYGADMKRGTGPEAVFPVAASFGYEPPMDELIRRAKGNGGLTRAKKVASDYCSAFLIARWAIEAKKTTGTYDVPGTSRYDTREIRKKEFHAQDS